MEQATDSALSALREFQRRMVDLQFEAEAIQHSLTRPDLLALARRTRELSRRTKGLLDGNTGVLFPHDPPRVTEELYEHVEFARAQISRALAEEHDFETIAQRLYMAVALCSYVIGQVALAVEKLLNEGGPPA